MMIWIAVAIGGALGSLARHVVNLEIARRFARPVPYATAIVNLVGSAVIGWLAGAIAAGKIEMSVPLRTFVFVGILGGFTTFSSFMLDTFTLAHGGEHTAAFANLFGQTLVGFGVVWAAYYAAMGT